MHLAATHKTVAGPFYHGTKADLRPGDLVTPGYRSNYGHGQRTNGWVYMSAILSPWAAELASGDQSARGGRLTLANGVLADAAHGEIRDFAAGRFGS